MWCDGSMRSSSSKKRPKHVVGDVEREERRRPDLEAPPSQSSSSDAERRPRSARRGTSGGRSRWSRYCRRPVRRVDLQPPRSVVGLPKSSWFHQLPMRPMPCASSSPGATASMNAATLTPGAADDDRAGERAEQDAAPDAEPALPDLEDALPLRRRHLVPGGDVVVGARADDAEADAPDRDADDEIPVAALRAPAPAGQPDRSDDRDEQRQPVEVERRAARRGRRRCAATG